jgi:hypothetical protein
MNRKGVDFSLKQVEPDLWKWQFQIGDTVTTGQTRSRLMGIAATGLKSGSIWSLESLATLCSSKAATVGGIFFLLPRAAQRCPVVGRRSVAQWPRSRSAGVIGTRR